MAINYTTLLGLAQPVPGTEANTWGDVVNDELTALVDSAIAGAATLNVTSGDVTLTDTAGAANQARMAILIATGTPGVTRNIVAPSQSKTYIVVNQANASVVLKGSATTGVAVREGQAATCVWNGTDFEIVASGDVDGPASSTDNAVARFDGTTGKIIQNSSVTIADDGTTVISTNSTTNALRITQTGTGNALLVEDSASPDATPFVVNNDGKVVVGATAGLATTSVDNGNAASGVRVDVSGTTVTSLALTGSGSTTARFSPSVLFNRTRGTYTVPTVAVSGDYLGRLDFQGYDGTAWQDAALIYAAVDGTPGTNDMPGRLVFSTTASGASTPTEAVRIDSRQQVTIGGTPVTGRTLRVAKNLTGATAVQGIQSGGTIQSDVTSIAAYFVTFPSTQAAAFTLSNLVHYDAAQGTFGAGSTVTNQYGFSAGASLIGATNNYGFYSNIASGTGRWNFYANGTAANYFAGNVGIGVEPTTKLHISGAGATARIVSSDNVTPNLTLERPSGRSYQFVNDAGQFRLKTAAASATPTFDTTIYTYSTNSHLFNDDTGANVVNITNERLILATGKGLTIARTSVTAPAASDGNVFSGTYTPTLTNSANVTSSTAVVCQYMRVGNVITVSGTITGIAVTAASASTIDISLPVASSFGTVSRCAGSGAFYTTALRAIGGGAIFANTTDNRARFDFIPSAAASAQAITFSFTYLVA